GSTEPGQEAIGVRALLLGERLDTRALESGRTLATAPLAISLPDGAVAVLFRYGAGVLFGASREAGDDFIRSIRPSITEPVSAVEEEQARVIIALDAEQLIDAAGNILLRERSVERLQLVADVLAKNLVLTHYETRIAAIFDRIEPLAAPLRKHGRSGARSKE